MIGSRKKYAIGVHTLQPTLDAVVGILFKKTSQSATTVLMTLCPHSNQLSCQRLHQHLRGVIVANMFQVEVGSGEQSLTKTSVAALARSNQMVRDQSITVPPRIEVVWPVFKRPQAYPQLTWLSTKTNP